jgi:parallel beta-helix repeat protein
LTRAVIAVEAGALAIQSCTIDASGVDGIAVVGASSRATITQTTVLRAAGYGINVDQRASVTIDDVEVTDAQVAGLRVVAGSIAANRLAVRGGPVAGIVLSAGATGTLSASEVTGIGRVNIAIVGSGTAPDVVGCTVRDGAGTGILVSENATPTIDRCTVSGQLGTGIEVCTDAYPIVRDCTVRDGRARGIWTRSGGRGEIERCSVTGHVSSADIEVTAATRIILAEVPGGTAPVVATRTSGAIGARPARPFRPRVTAPPTEGVRGSTFTDSATSATPGVLPRVVASARVLAS